VYIFYDDTGKIIAAVAADHPGVVLTRIPEGTTPLYLDDATYADVWNNLGEYTIQNGVPVYTPIPDSVKLANAQQAKIAQLRQSYAQTLASGFNVTIGGTQYTFGWQTDDKANLTALQKAIDQGFITFPVQYADIHGNPVTIPDQATLNTVEQTATRFFNAQHQQLLNLIAQVQAATTVSAVQAITWTPASY
jgi:hypothetical protein